MSAIDTVKNVGAPLALTAVVALAFTQLDDHYGWPVKDDDIAVYSPFIAGGIWGGWVALRKLLVIIYRGVENRLKKWAG